MIGFDYGHGWSSTGWETSFYGGYDRTLYDMPDVKVDYDVRVSIPLKSKMSYYSGQKLLKTFLLRVKTLRLTDMLLHKSTIEKKKTWGGFGSDKRVIVVSKKGIENTLDYIINQETELKNLFEHYKQDIIDSDIEFTLKDDDKKEPASGKSTSDLVNDLIGKTTVMKPYKSFSSISGDGSVPDPEFHIQVQDYRDAYMGDDHKLLAKQIVNKLDITFDPDRDEIHSLKQGKLDVRKLAEAVAHNDHIYYRTEEDQKTKPFSVVMLCDESGSMRSYDRIDKQYDLVKILYTAFSEIMPQDRISVYGHSGQETPEIYVYQDKYNPGFMKTISNMRGRDLRENYDGPVVESIHERIRSQSSDNILFIVISDGQPSGENYGGTEAMNDLKRIIEKCKRDSFVTMGIGFGYSGVKELYSYHTVIDDMKSQVVEKVTTLLNKVVKTEFQ